MAKVYIRRCCMMGMPRHREQHLVGSQTGYLVDGKLAVNIRTFEGFVNSYETTSGF